MKHKCGKDCLEGFDIDKMEEALKGPFYTMPSELSSIEEMRNWLITLANSSDEENEQYLSGRNITLQ